LRQGKACTRLRHGGAREKFSSTQTSRWPTSKRRLSFQAEACPRKRVADWGALKRSAGRSIDTIPGNRGTVRTRSLPCGRAARRSGPAVGQRRPLLFARDRRCDHQCPPAPEHQLTVGTSVFRQASLRSQGQALHWASPVGRRVSAMADGGPTVDWDRTLVRPISLSALLPR
jgi:hypothetical protein